MTSSTPSIPASSTILLDSIPASINIQPFLPIVPFSIASNITTHLTLANLTFQNIQPYLQHKEMAPSRGPTPQLPPQNQDAALTQQSTSALTSAKRNLNYLISPASTTDKPLHFRTRALLRTLRYIGQFILWRLVRWAKYIAVGAAVAAVGSVLSPVAWIAAPTGLGASILAAGVWGVGRFAARRLHARWVRDGGAVGEEVRERAEERGGDVRREGAYGLDVGPGAVPW